MTTNSCTGSSHVWHIYVCISYFACCCDKIPQMKATSERKGLFWLILEGYSTSWYGVSSSRTWNSWSYCIQGQEECDEPSCTASSLFCSVQIQARKCWHFFFRVDLPISVSRSPPKACSEALFLDNPRACHSESLYVPSQTHPRPTWHSRMSILSHPSSPCSLPSQCEMGSVQLQEYS